MTLYLNNKKGLFHATCEYQNSVYIVKKGSKIKSTFADYIKGGKTSKRYRDNAEYVNSEGILLQDCIFKSPSTAAQFVMGASANGRLVWKNADGKKLKDII